MSTDNYQQAARRRRRNQQLGTIGVAVLGLVTMGAIVYAMLAI